MSGWQPEMHRTHANSSPMPTILLIGSAIIVVWAWQE
jgi:hypothetical protein